MRKLTVASVLALALSLQAAAPVPRQAKEFTIVQPSGGKKLLSSYRGKVVMFACIFTTCPHCQALSQVMSKLQNEMGPEGFQAVAVAFNDEVGTPDQRQNAAVAGAFENQFHLNFPLGYAPRQTIMDYLGLSIMDRLWVVPQIMIIDKKGVIRAQSDPKGTDKLQTEDYLRNYIGELLKEGGAPAKAKSSTKPGTAKKTAKKPS
jgi:peroxiredoxin